jgi:hypothetical protein
MSAPRDRVERRCVRQAAHLGLAIAGADLVMLADRIQHHRAYPDDVSFIERESRRLTTWSVRVGPARYRVSYDTHRHVVDAFIAKESERADVDSSTRVDPDHRTP